MNTARQNWKTAYSQARKQIKGAIGIYGAHLPWYGSSDEHKAVVNRIPVCFEEYRGTIEITRSTWNQDTAGFNRMLGFAELRLWQEYRDPEEFSPKEAAKFFEKARQQGFKLP